MSADEAAVYVEVVESGKYLGSVIHFSAASSEAVKDRTRLAHFAYSQLTARVFRYRYILRVVLKLRLLLEEVRRQSMTLKHEYLAALPDFELLTVFT